jgi:hypothetical protein
MGVAPGPSSGGASAISRFLAEHQDHDAGFDVGREAGSGSGRLRIVCLGCGESVEYRAAEGGPDIRAQLEASRPSSQERQRPPKRPAAAKHRPAGRSGRPSLPAIGLAILIVALVLTGILLLTGNGSDDSKGTTTTAPATVATQPAPAATPPPPQPEPRAPRLHGTTFYDQYRIGVPGGWRSEPKDQETVLVGPGGTPEIDVYYALDHRGLDALGTSAVSFLKDRHPAGHVTGPTPRRVGELQALRVEATYPDGSETALVMTSGAYAYLVVARVDRHDDPYRERQAAAAPDTFRPL